MPPTLRPPSKIAPVALFFITVGALTTVWSIIWYVYLANHNARGGIMYVCFGVLGTGIVLLVIGFTMGKLGRAAREAELPPEEEHDEPPVRPTGPSTTTHAAPRNS